MGNGRRVLEEGVDDDYRLSQPLRSPLETPPPPTMRDPALKIGATCERDGQTLNGGGGGGSDGGSGGGV